MLFTGESWPCWEEGVGSMIGGISLDVAGGKIYFCEIANGKILRADLDGTHIQEIITGLVWPTAVDVRIAP